MFNSPTFLIYLSCFDQECIIKKYNGNSIQKKIHDI